MSDGSVNKAGFSANFFKGERALLASQVNLQGANCNFGVKLLTFELSYDGWNGCTAWCGSKNCLQGLTTLYAQHIWNKVHILEKAMSRIRGVHVHKIWLKLNLKICWTPCNNSQDPPVEYLSCRALNA